MPLQLRWVGEESYERLAETRMRCYAPAANMLPKYLDSLQKFHRAKPGDFLLAERDGEAVGTATSLSLNIWMRGGRIPCQGVAYVGTIKTARRMGGGDEKGIATQLMFETLRKAREREQPISALMPFRASYYEHFGYGNAEHRTLWTIPVSILPRGDFGGFRFYREADLPKLMAMRQRECESGQCDIETSPQAWEIWMAQWPDGLVAVDEAPDETTDGSIQSMVFIEEERGSARAVLNVSDVYTASPAAMLRVLYFLASMKDQYSDVTITLPGDYPLNRVLRESQIPHRQVDHPVAVAKPFTRMQIRVLDHKKTLEAMMLPTSTRGKLNVSVRECEGATSRFSIDVTDGRIAVAPTIHTTDVELTDVLWASVVSGDLPASKAQQLGLLSASVSPAGIALLDAFSVGPTPYCQEYF